MSGNGRYHGITFYLLRADCIRGSKTITLSTKFTWSLTSEHLEGDHLVVTVYEYGTGLWEWVYVFNSLLFFLIRLGRTLLWWWPSYVQACYHKTVLNKVTGWQRNGILCTYTLLRCMIWHTSNKYWDKPPPPLTPLLILHRKLVSSNFHESNLQDSKWISYC